MRPTLDEVLDGIRISFERDIVPELSSDWSRRIATVALDAIEHVRLRLEREERLLSEEHSDLRETLSELAALGIHEAKPSGGLPQQVAGTSPQAQREQLESEVLAMRWALNTVIRTHGGDGQGQGAPGSHHVSGYLTRQLNREDQLIPGSQ